MIRSLPLAVLTLDPNTDKGLAMSSRVTGRYRDCVKTHWILPASAVWFINFNLTSHELFLDTIGFSRVEFQFRPIFARKQSWRLKLKLHAAEADGICDHLSPIRLGAS